MQFSTLLLSVATIATTTLAFAIATPASAQEHYGHKHYAHTHYAHARYRHSTHYDEGRQIVVHPVQVQTRGYAWGPVAAIGSVVGGTGQAVQGSLYRRRRRCGRDPGRSVWRYGGALRLPAELRVWRSVRRAVQCDWVAGRSAVPVGQRRSRSAAACERWLLSRFPDTSAFG